MAGIGNDINYDENVRREAKEIENQLMHLRRLNTGNCFINSIDPLLKSENPLAFRPYYIVIGPHRSYDDILENIEVQKRIYLDSFLTRARQSARLEDFVQLITNSAVEIQGCYDQAHYRCWDFQSKKVSQRNPVTNDKLPLITQMVLVDACFIIELFCTAYYMDGRRGSHFIFEKLGNIRDIRRDLFLAHNQLPFFIINNIYELAFRNVPDAPPFVLLACHFFRPYYNQNTPVGELIKAKDARAKLESAKHLTDFLRTLQLREEDSSPRPASSEKSLFSCSKLWPVLLPSSKKEEEDLEATKANGAYLYGAVLLRQAGVKFKVRSSKCLLDIRFNKNNGHLEIPPLKLDESTESFFRNLIAWEQSYYPINEGRIRDYIFMMEYLIKSEKDVDLLVQKRILINNLGSHEAVKALFTSFCRYIDLPENNTYTHVFKDVNAYCASFGNSTLATLKLQYFPHPWKSLATIAAVVLLALTLIQTICAIISL